MSLATRQAMLMISMVNGVLKLLAEEPEVPPEIAPTVMWADDFCTQLLDRYPETGNPIKNNLWMKEHLKKWDQIGADKLIRWHPAVVTVFALNMVEDLLDKIKNAARDDLVILRDTLVNISYFFSESGKEYDLYDEATQVTDEVYLVIGFSR